MRAIDVVCPHCGAKSGANCTLPSYAENAKTRTQAKRFHRARLKRSWAMTDLWGKK